MTTCVIPRHEKAPVTDQEWEEALAEYGRDRDNSLPSSAFDFSESITSSVPLSSSPPLISPQVITPDPFIRSLVHESGSREPLDGAGRQTDTSGRPLRPIRPKRSHDTTPSWSSESRRRDGLSQVSGVPLNGFSSRGLVGSEDSSEFTEDLENGIPGSDSWRPSAATSRDAKYQDTRSANAERRRLREAYERDGWLSAPEPSRKSLLRRKRARRRLGLGGDVVSEIQAVMANYADMAKQIFQTSSAEISVILDEEEVRYPSNLDVASTVIAAAAGICSHAVMYANEKCTVIADLSNDWRFARNPHRPEGSKFYASAALRVRNGDVSVDIGTVCVYDRKSRVSFVQREQGILLNLANMLVYQLTTLQSEIEAKSSSSMYEASIGFLRRAVMTEFMKRPTKREGSQFPRQRLPPSRTDASTDVSPEDPVLAVKPGPRDIQSTKRAALLPNRELFNDVAATLRRMLKADAVAIVHMGDFQVFVRRKTDPDIRPSGKEHGNVTADVIANFLLDKPWPANIEPVVQHVARTSGTSDLRIPILGADGDLHFHFDRSDAVATMGDFLQSWLRSRRAWWDREDADDEMTQRIMALVPEQCQITLTTEWMTADGKQHFATFVSWCRPPPNFDESDTAPIRFAGILGGHAMAALAISKVRSVEQSQISYSNLQAHELRTPLHQMLAINQLLRSAMNDLADTPREIAYTPLTTIQQIRDLLPFLDAIDTSGKTLHGIIDNILSFLDLKAKDNTISTQSSPFVSSPSGAMQSLETVFEELIHDACEEDKLSRTANGQPIINIETVFEIIPPLLGEQITEDGGGSLRRVLTKILSNAYKFIDSEGCVEIYVDDVPTLLPPQGCEDLSTSKYVSIKIVDSGRGMEQSFVREKLGEPWAKEDLYATGSGLSVHLAYRIVDFMGGHMEISSAPGRGCSVQIEVPLPRRHVSLTSSPDPSSTEPSFSTDPGHLAVLQDQCVQRKVGLVGFDLGPVGTYGLNRLGSCLERQYRKLGCEIVPLEEAELVVIEGRQEESDVGAQILRKAKTDDIVFLVSMEHEADPHISQLESDFGMMVRRFRKPATPSILRESLFPGHSKAFQAEQRTSRGMRQGTIRSPDQVDRHGDVTPNKPEIHLGEAQDPVSRPRGLKSGLSQPWKPKGMPVEEAVASLCLGDYLSSRRRFSHVRIPSNSSSGPITSNDSVSPLARSEKLNDAPPVRGDTPLKPEPDKVKVLVVEDNLINRKVLVKILASKKSLEICEAEDGVAAVEIFQGFTAPAIVLLDINMPRMDGFQACWEMRAIEKAMPARGRSQIIAVTAMGGEVEKRRGLVESGMDQWLSKPCGKAMIQKVVDEAREILLEAKEAVGMA